MNHCGKAGAGQRRGAWDQVGWWYRHRVTLLYGIGHKYRTKLIAIECERIFELFELSNVVCSVLWKMFTRTKM